VFHAPSGVFHPAFFEGTVIGDDADSTFHLTPKGTAIRSWVLALISITSDSDATRID
jgi:hypothetical protein